MFRSRCLVPVACSALLALGSGCDRPAGAPQRTAAVAQSKPSAAKTDGAVPVEPEARVVLRLAQPEPAKLVPEQRARLELVLRNEGTTSEQVIDPGFSQFQPVVHLFDAKGKKLHSMQPSDASSLAGIDPGFMAPRPPTLRRLKPGQRLALDLDLWSYTLPFGPGRLALEVEHDRYTSNRITWEIVPARVSACALAYPTSLRRSSVLAWVATRQGAKPEAFVRISGPIHAVAAHGGTSLGGVSRQTRVALGQVPPDGVSSPVGWVALVDGSTVELVLHLLSRPRWRTGRIDLAARGLRPVPRFPQLGEAALFLATGERSGRGVLVGVGARRQAREGPWSVSLPFVPTRSACVVTEGGKRITLLLVGKTGLWRLSLDARGKLLAPVRPARETSRRVLAITAEQRDKAPPGFWILERDRALSARVWLVFVPVSGSASSARALPLPSGSKVDEAALELDAQGRPWVALRFADGKLLGGPLAGPLQLHAAKGVRFPHVAALAHQINVAAFSERGTLHVGTGRRR